VTGPKNLAASIRERLRNRATAEHRPFDEVLAYYAIERFLFRLSKTPHRDHFILKGALMLPLWGATIARPTRDIDLLGRGSPTADQLAAVIADCIAADVPPDALSFDASSIETREIREQERYGGIRATFRATLERARIKMQVDVGLGDVVTPKPVMITYPALLELPAPELVGYPVETAIAEKLEALVDLGMANSRMKDFFDLSSLLGNLDLDGRTIAMKVIANLMGHTSTRMVDLVYGRVGPSDYEAAIARLPGGNQSHAGYTHAAQNGGTHGTAGNAVAQAAIVNFDEESAIFTSSAVPRVGIEPTTRGFSVRCSTN
jgi:nucleotidyltransferase AbiEii toxin of type IV toxin-antitoxin system